MLRYQNRNRTHKTMLCYCHTSYCSIIITQPTDLSLHNLIFFITHTHTHTLFEQVSEHVPTARIVNVDQVRRKSLCVQQSFHPDSPESSPVSPVARSSLLFQQSSQNFISQSVLWDRISSKNEVDDKDKDVDYRSEDPHSDEQSAISTPSTPLSCDDMEPLLSPFLGKGGGEVQPCYPHIQ